MGLNMKIVDEKTIQWMGGDAYRIARYISNLETTLSVDGNIIIPKSSLNEIKRVLETTDDDVKIFFDSNTFQVFTDHIKFKTRLIESEFPNLDRVMNNSGPITMGIDRKHLLNAVKVLHQVSDDSANSVVKLTLLEGTLQIESQKMEFGEGMDEIPCDYVGEEMKIGVNTKFFIDALLAFEGTKDDLILMNFTTPVSPIGFTVEGWESFKTVLMPVKITW